MKTVILNASPRRKGSTARLLDEVRAGLKGGGEVEWIDVNNLQMAPCKACLGCRPDRECVLKEDDAHRIGRKIKKADVLVIGSPNYVGNITGPLKTLFDRVLTSIEVLPPGGMPSPIIKGRKSAIITSCGCPFPFSMLKSQSWGTINSIKTFLKAGGYDIKGILNLPFAAPEREINESYLKRARRIGAGIS